MISVLILTRDEEANIADCIACCRDWSDDVHVFDSFSTDRTVDIALANGAHLHQRQFDNYAAQRNAALETVPFRHDWIFIVDADERPSPALGAEMLARASDSPAGVSAYKVLRKDYFLGRWLKHAQMSPWYIRLVRRGHARYRREVNEVLETDGEVRALASPMDHFPFSRGVEHWIAKHNLYSTMEAKLIVAGAPHTEISWRTAVFERDFHKKRVAQKAIFYRLPFRPFVKWCYLMFARGGMLDGRAGFAYANLLAWYEYMIVVKTKQLRLQAKTADSALR